MLTVQMRLQAARDAYHKLMTGQMARVIVDQNGERVEFVAANASKLLAYIKQLESEMLNPVQPRAQTPYRYIF